MLINWKGCGNFIAFFRDSALRESRMSAQFWVRCVANCTLAAEIGWERLKKSLGERGAAFHNNSQRVKRFHNHYLAVREMQTLLNKQSEQEFYFLTVHCSFASYCTEIHICIWAWRCRYAVVLHLSAWNISYIIYICIRMHWYLRYLRQTWGLFRYKHSWYYSTYHLDLVWCCKCVNELR